MPCYLLSSIVLPSHLGYYIPLNCGFCYQQLLIVLVRRRRRNTRKTFSTGSVRTSLQPYVLDHRIFTVSYDPRYIRMRSDSNTYATSTFISRTTASYKPAAVHYYFEKRRGAHYRPHVKTISVLCTREVRMVPGRYVPLRTVGKTSFSDDRTDAAKKRNDRKQHHHQTASISIYTATTGSS